MAPGGSCLSQHEFFERINVLVSLGLPIDNIKVHPHIISCCQPSVSPTPQLMVNLERAMT